MTHCTNLAQLRRARQCCAIGLADACDGGLREHRALPTLTASAPIAPLPVELAPLKPPTFPHEHALQPSKLGSTKGSPTPFVLRYRRTADPLTLRRALRFPQGTGPEFSKDQGERNGGSSCRAEPFDTSGQLAPLKPLNVATRSFAFSRAS